MEKREGPVSGPPPKSKGGADGSLRHVGKLRSKRCAELVRLVVDRRICVVNVAGVVLVESDRSDSSGLGHLRCYVFDDCPECDSG